MRNKGDTMEESERLDLIVLLWGVHDCEALADKVIDFYNKRVCENCLYDYGCDIQDTLELEDYSFNFGCNKFKRKEGK